MLTACTDGGSLARSRSAAEVAVVPPPAALDPTAEPLQVELLAATADRTDQGRIRWTGRARVSGNSATEHTMVLKTTCLEHGTPITAHDYAVVDGRDSNVGVPHSGPTFDFVASGGSPRHFSSMCEVRAVLMNRVTARTVPTISGRACFSDQGTRLGRCETDLRVPSDFGPIAWEFDADRSQSLHFVASVGERFSSEESLFGKVACLQSKAPLAGEVVVSAGRGYTGWGMLSPGEAGRDQAHFSSSVVNDATDCRLTLRRVTSKPGGDIDFAIGSGQEVVLGCWPDRRDRDCDHLASPPRDEAAEPVTLKSASVHRRGTWVDIAVGATLHRPQWARGGFRAIARCGGEDHPTSLQPSAPVAVVDAGETILLEGTYWKIPDQHCRATVEVMADGEWAPVGSLCIDGSEARICHQGEGLHPS